MKVKEHQNGYHAGDNEAWAWSAYDDQRRRERTRVLFLARRPPLPEPTPERPVYPDDDLTDLLAIVTTLVIVAAVMVMLYLIGWVLP